MEDIVYLHHVFFPSIKSLKSFSFSLSLSLCARNAFLAPDRCLFCTLRMLEHNRHSNAHPCSQGTFLFAGNETPKAEKSTAERENKNQ